MKTLALAVVLFVAQEKAPEGATVLDASQFVHEDGKASTWPVADGVLEVGKGSVMTKEKYADFQLHVEFNIPEPPEGAKDQARSNSGVYIQRRYEVQILETFGLEPVFNSCGAIYRQKPPDKNAGKKAGEWQTYDITFQAPRFGPDGKKTANGKVLKVVHNGTVIHENVELTRTTTSALSTTEKPQGPLMLQGDHGPVAFRNLRIKPLAGSP